MNKDNSMRNIFFIILISFSLSAYLENIPVTLIQSDNTVISCFVSGDEFYARLHNENNYTIIQSNTDGFYYFAVSIEGVMLPSSCMVGKCNPEETILESGLLISRENYILKKKNFYKNFSGRDAPTVGIINNINIFIRFSGESEFTTPRSYYDEPFNDINGPSINHYYKEVSYNNLEINTTHYPICELNSNLSYQDPHPRSYYQIYNAITNPDGYIACPDWQGSSIYDCNEIDSTLWSSYREQTLLKNAIEFIENEVSDSLIVDSDEDGYVDNVTFLVNGSPDGWAELLWPHRSSLYLYDVNINDALVDGYNLNLASGGYFNASVLCHEFGHSLGAPDLYRYFDTGNNVTPIGQWDIMGWNTSFPQYPSAWTKYRYFHWIECPLIEASGVYELNPISMQEDNCFLIRSPFSETQHFVVEYRRNEGMYDSYLPGNSNGMLVYRINLDINENGIIDTIDTSNPWSEIYPDVDAFEGWSVGGNGFGPPDEMYVYRPNGSSESNGSINSAIFSSQTGRTEINDSTNPSSFLSDGSPGGLIISNIGYPDETIQFFCSIECMNSVLGDINNDQIVDILDLILVVNYILLGNYESCSDLNSDGLISILDVIQIINIILA